MDWSYEAWPMIAPDWGDACGHDSEWDRIDWHVDLGCGRKKKGRIGIDKYPDDGVNIVMDFDTGHVYSVAGEPGEDAPYARSPDAWEQAMGFQPPTVCHGLPFADNSVESMISHHALEHVGAGFVPLVDEVYRVLRHGSIFRVITPLFPSRSAVDDSTHQRLMTESTWAAFCGRPEKGGHWYESFATPYTRARFEIVDQDVTPRVPVHQWWTESDSREIRTALRAIKS